MTARAQNSERPAHALDSLPSRRGALAALVAAGISSAAAQAPVGLEEKTAPPASPPVPSAPAHDPSTIIKHRGRYWTFTTGNGVHSLSSGDLVRWERGPRVFSSPPPWIKDVAPTQRGHFWAPDVIELDGRGVDSPAK